jgi:hypothetical protein
MSTIVTIPRVKGTRYKAVIRLAGVKPFSRTFNTRKAAEHWAKHQEDNVDLLRAGVDIKALRMTLASLCDDYMPPCVTLRAIAANIGRSTLSAIPALRPLGFFSLFRCCVTDSRGVSLSSPVSIAQSWCASFEPD